MGRFTRWSALRHIDGKYDVYSIMDDFDGLHIYLHEDGGPGRQVELFFDHGVEAYHAAVEHCLIDVDTWGPLDDIDVGSHTFFSIEDSEYVEKIQAYSCDTLGKLVHHCILGTNHIVDIVVMEAADQVEIRPFPAEFPVCVCGPSC